MSTSNKRVFDKFLALIKSRNICTTLTDNDMTALLNTFLSESSFVYFKNCTKDLSLNKPYEFYEQTFIADGIDNEFTISQYPNSPNPTSISYIAKVDGIDAAYSFDDLNLIFTITPLPTIGQTVLCGYNFIGQFDEDLNEEECWILAHGMLITWISGNIMTDSILSDMIVTINFSTPHSPANLLDKLVMLRKQTLREIRQLTVSYSFNGFSGFN